MAGKALGLLWCPVRSGSVLENPRDRLISSQVVLISATGLLRSFDWSIG